MAVYPYKKQLPIIGENVYLDETAKVIGDVIIGKDSSVWALVVIRGDVNRIVIGERTNVQEGSVLHCSPDCRFYPGGFPLIIGNNVSIGHKSILHGCTIMDNCLIGMGVIILDGAELESEVIIGAGSVVPPGKKLASGYLYIGSPVKQLRELNETEKWLLDYNADCYVQLKNDFIKGA
jgi:carbonic anhydrase/acetyltransferase-like protein (isoleucine patch superfamily)